MSLFAELKRRNVVRVAMAYGVVAWLLAQVADLLFGAFDAPAWAMRTFIILLLLGFPVALVLAWAFELTPEGLKRESNTGTEPPRPAGSGRKFDVFIVGVLAIAVTFLLFDRFVPINRNNAEHSAAMDIPPSVAVLPFENRSANAEDAFFVDGIHDDILTQLARIQSLKVISRSSVMRYRDLDRSIPEIQEDLGVGTVLEGGVQRAGDSVRINVQLINAAADELIWSDSFDRELSPSNIFEIQSEIATAVARALRATLTPEVASQIATAPTQNLQAYDAYQQAKAIIARGNWGTSYEAAALFEEAVLLDPDFAQAYASLAQVHVNHYWYFDRNEADLRRAKAALDRALSIEPDMPEGLITLADYYYKGFRDYDRALELLDKAIPRAPKLSIAVARRAFILRRSGRVEESIMGLKEAMELDPLSAIRHYTLGQTLNMVGRYEEAQGSFDQSVALNPNDYTVHAARAYNLRAIDPASRAMHELLHDPEYSDQDHRFWVLYRWRMGLLEGDYEVAIQTLSKSTTNLVDLNQAYYPMDLMSGLTEYLLGERDAAGPLFESAKAILEAARLDSPEDVRILDALALAHAGLGEAVSAKAAADAAVALSPVELDSVSGPAHVLNRARVLAMLGDQGAALEDLQTLLSIPLVWMIGPVAIRNDPTFDQLRDRPEFQAMFRDR
jgi:TolB-like protein/Tfp pilus assembly protein PilF